MKIQNTTSFFAKAHKIAKATVATVGDYKIAFKLALDGLYAEAKKVVKSVSKPVKAASKSLRKPTKKAAEIFMMASDLETFANIAKDQMGWSMNTIKTQFNVAKKWFAEA